MLYYLLMTSIVWEILWNISLLQILVKYNFNKMKNEHLIKYKNPVLIKDEEGKVKQTTFDLPPENHAYGKKVVDDPEPIKHVVNGWQTANQSGEIPSKQKNFKQLNKMSVQSGLHTAKDQAQFRKTNDVMVQTKKGQKVIPIMLPEQKFTYGVPNRPSTPIKLVVGNCYGLQHEQKNKTMYQSQANKNKSTKVSAKTTKAQNLRQKKTEQTKQYRERPIFEQKFKMSKFTTTNAPRIDTNLKPFASTNSQVVQNNASGQVANQSAASKQNQH